MRGNQFIFQFFLSREAIHRSTNIVWVLLKRGQQCEEEKKNNIRPLLSDFCHWMMNDHRSWIVL